MLALPNIVVFYLILNRFNFPLHPFPYSKSDSQTIFPVLVNAVEKRIVKKIEEKGQAHSKKVVLTKTKSLKEMVATFLEFYTCLM